MENQNSKAAVITPSYWDEGDYRCVVAAGILRIIPWSKEL